MSYKSIQIPPHIITLGKFILGGLLLLAIYTQLDHASAVWEDGYSIAISGRTIGLLVLLISLVPLNWFLETKKWISLFQDTPITLRHAFSNILMGTTLALVTPARVGEYGGRLIGIDDVDRSQALFATLVGSILQNAVNVIVGMVALLILLYQHHTITWDHGVYILTASLLSLGSIILLVVFRRSLRAWLRHWIPTTWHKHISNISLYQKDVYTALVFALLRYTIYTIQYLLVVNMLGLSSDLGTSILVISSLFMIQSLLPLPAILSLLARSEFALMLWGLVTQDTIGILCTTFLLWIVNLLIPALCGYILILRKKYLFPSS